MSDPSGQRPDCDGDCLKEWAAVQTEEGRQRKAEEDRIDNDIDAPCNAVCAKRRLAKARAQANAHLGPPLLTEKVVATGGEQQFALEDVPLSMVFGDPYVAKDYSSKTTVSETTEWAEGMGGVNTMSADAEISGEVISGKFSDSCEDSWSYTWTKSVTTEVEISDSFHTDAGKQYVVVPIVSVKWETVQYSGHRSDGTTVDFTQMRMKVTYLGPQMQPVKLGSIPSGGKSANDVGASILKHLG
ncbi:hypothetical protein ABT297_31325 [Dactylosporangium sp. NPDC000555]|uniref:hypothetical protein n=1 Tax=Dactylosporangium sp. NPDC000555 TaxID=3154260 RepID=UPI0033210893